MAHIKVERRSMRPEEWTDLRFCWLKRYIYSEKWEIQNLMIRDARQVAEMEFQFYPGEPRPLKRGDMNFTPDGTALPCHGARQLPVQFPNVRDHDLHHIWYESFGFNRFRGYEWMREPCRSCDEKEKDFGGCRCQAFMLTGDASNADPVCAKSAEHGIILKAREEAETAQLAIEQMTFRNDRNSRVIARG